MKSNFIHVCFIIDCSGSMYSSSSDVEGGFSKVIEEQKALKDGTCAVSLFEFDSNVSEIFIGKDVNEVQNYKHSARGCTALFDGVGTAITKIGNWLNSMPEAERPEKNLIVIMTDGYENASIEYDSFKIKEMIKHQEDKYNWTFMYIGTDISNAKDADNMGISYKMASTRDNYVNTYYAVNVAVSNYRSVTGDCKSKDMALNESITASADTLNTEYLKATGININSEK